MSTTLLNKEALDAIGLDVRPNVFRRNLLSSRLDAKPFSERMTAEDECELSFLMQRVWLEMMQGIDFDRAEVVDIDDLFYREEHTKGVPDLTWRENGEALLSKCRDGGSPLLGLARIQDLYDVAYVGGVMQFSGAPQVILAVGDVPWQKNEKETRLAKNNNRLELPMYRRIPWMMCSEELRGTILVDGHSGVSSLEFLRLGVAAADLTAAPALISRALQDGLLDGERCNIVSDTGAMNYALYMATELDISEGVQTGKNSTEDTPLLYPKEDWEIVRGKIAVFLDDRLMTFGTGAEPIEKALRHGAVSAVFLVTYPEFSGPALEIFRKLRDDSDGRVHVVTTDMFIPKDDHGNVVDITSEPNIHIVRQQERLLDVLGLTKQGINILDPANRCLLRNIGFDIAPWMFYNHGKT